MIASLFSYLVILVSPFGWRPDRLSHHGQGNELSNEFGCRGIVYVADRES